MQNYPRMLYRVGKGNGALVWGHRIDTLIVQSLVEELKAVKKGWLLDPNIAVKKSIRKENLSRFWLWFVSHWQFWIATVISIIGIIVAVLSLK